MKYQLQLISTASNVPAIFAQAIEDVWQKSGQTLRLVAYEVEPANPIEQGPFPLDATIARFTSVFHEEAGAALILFKALQKHLDFDRSPYRVKIVKIPEEVV